MPKYLFQIKYFNCTIYCAEREGDKQQHWLKYHSIRNTEHHKAKFLRFVKEKFPSAQYCNFYNKENRNFVERIYLE